MKTALKRLSGNESDILISTGNVLVKTIVVANTSDKGISAKLYVSSGSEETVVFHGNVYPNTNLSVYLSKDVQFYLGSGEKLRGTASRFTGVSLGDELADVIVSYEGDSMEASSSSSSSSSSLSSSSSSSDAFLNYNRSSIKNTVHVNWGLLRSAISSNYENWGSF